MFILKLYVLVITTFNANNFNLFIPVASCSILDDNKKFTSLFLLDIPVFHIQYQTEKRQNRAFLKAFVRFSKNIFF